MDGIGWLSQVIGILSAPSVLITWSNVQKYDIDANGRKYYTVKSWETAKKKYCSDLHRKRLVQSKLSWIKVQIAKMHMFNNEKKFSILMKWILLMWNFWGKLYWTLNQMQPFQLGFYNSGYCNFLLFMWYIVHVFIDIE